MSQHPAFEKFLTCLRPEYTALIVKKLHQQRLSLNVIGATGTGKERLLQDIKKVAEKELLDVQVILVNMKNYVHNYQGLLREIHAQLHLTTKLPKKLSDVFIDLDKQKKYWLFLHQYDAILDKANIDERYDKDFIDDLNFLKNRDHICLLCTTEKAHDTKAIFIKEEAFRNSWLDLNILPPIKPLTFEQIEMNLTLALQEEYQQAFSTLRERLPILRNLIHGRSDDYAFMQYMCDRLIHQNKDEERIPFDRRLNNWEKDYNTAQQDSASKKIVKKRMNVTTVYQAIGLHKWKLGFIKDLWDKLMNKIGG